MYFNTTYLFVKIQFYLNIKSMQSCVKICWSYVSRHALNTYHSIENYMYNFSGTQEWIIRSARMHKNTMFPWWNAMPRGHKIRDN